ncbi:MAG: hypothetical protein DWB99_08225 [Candidatus Poseidoniales archaeon]|nr:MAG: hypothetical protein DWB99_08225 [Candidatus Poseidoniales archaeon]
MGGSKNLNHVVETESGPWMAINEQDIIPLSRGEIVSVNVSWKGKDLVLFKPEGIIALTRIKGKGRNAMKAHETLLLALESDDPEIREAGLKALPEVATQKSDELFDWLSVLLDDSDVNVRQAASKCLSLSAPVFPSGVQVILQNELRSYNKSRMDAAWKGLNSLCETWPSVACEHIDTLLLEEDPIYRRKAAKLLRKLLSKGGSVTWDLISWALDDEDVEVRRNAAKTLPSLARNETRLATIFSERAIIDSDPKVRLSAVKAIQGMDKDSGRARELILQSASSKDINIRRACIEMLPKLYSEEVLRGVATDLLKSEVDPKLRKELKEMTIDESLEGSESQKNKFLAPSPSVPKLDREVAEAHGIQLGLEKLTTEVNVNAASKKPLTEEERNIKKNESLKEEAMKNNPLYRPVSQDEMMGYDEDDYLMDSDDEEF